jgi:hypothetical protein
MARRITIPGPREYSWPNWSNWRSIRWLKGVSSGLSKTPNRARLGMETAAILGMSVWHCQNPSKSAISASASRHLDECRIKGRGVSMKKSVCQSLIGFTMIFAVACQARADVQILKPDQIVAGHTQLFWAQTWWQWLLNITAAINPANDPDGRFAANGNNFDVFFLAGTFSPGGTASRTITVPFGKAVFFPVVNSVFGAVNSTTGAFDPTPCKTYS